MPTDTDQNDLPAPRHPSLPAMASSAAQRFGPLKAFTCVMPNGMHGSLTYAQVDEMSDAFAAYLRDMLGLAAGDRVALQMPNVLAYPVCLIGILKAGCVAVNTNPLYTAREMQHQFADSGAKALVIVDLFMDRLEQALPGTDVKHVVMARVPEFFPAVVGSIVYGVMKWWNRQVPSHGVQATRLPEALAQGRARLSSNAYGPSSAPGTTGSPITTVRAWWEKLGHEDLALLQYTGGTTGVAKGAMLTHGNLLWNVEQMRSMASSRLDDGKEVVLTALPLYHIFAFTVNFLMMYAAGAHNILVPSPRPVQNLQRAIENHRITWITGVNTLYNALLNEEWFVAFPPRHIKAAGGGGAAMHRAVVERWERVTGAPLVEGYGLTETSPVVCFQPLEAARIPDSIGRPAPGTQVRLVGDAGQDVAYGEPGELLVKGPQVMRGYWQRDDETAQVLSDGWLRTGDIAVRDAQDNFRIVDRRKDMILVSGFNVYPNEIEDVLAMYDKVLEAAVVGVPDARTGEAVAAYVVRQDPTLTAEEVREHCRRQLAAYKVPSRVEFRDELPKSAIGKILRKDLRQPEPSGNA
jgi:long-chain acyl-CoA synthetase